MRHVKRRLRQRAGDEQLLAGHRHPRGSDRTMPERRIGEATSAQPDGMRAQVQVSAVRRR